MQSSPPQRAANGPPSPATSQYSIDLAALELDSRSGASTPLPTQHVDEVLSEDIDGPSDFTQNMEAWMRGGTLRKRGLPSLSEKRDEDGAPLATAAKNEAKLLVEEENGRTASNHTPSNSPPMESVVDHRRNADDEKENIEDNSIWSPQVESRTPTLQHMEGKAGLLQPTVEEYYSELTPGRAAATRTAKSVTGDGEREQQHSPSKSEQLLSEGRASSPTLSPKRSPIFQRSAPQPSNTQDNTLQQELEQLRTQCRHLEHLNTVLNQTIEQERQQRKDDTAAHEAQLAEFARREQDLAEMKDQSHEHKEDFRREFSEMKEQIQKYEKQQESYRAELDRLHSAYGPEMKKLREQIEHERYEHENELHAIEQDMELARRGKDDAEESAKTNREELDERIAEVDRLKMEIQQGEELREGIKEQLRSARMESERLAGEKKAKESAEKEVDAVRRTKDEDIETLKNEHAEVVEILRKQVGEARQQLKGEQMSLNAHNEPSSDELRREIESLRESYNTAIVERDALQDELTATQEELTVEQIARQGEKEDAEVVNAALSVKISSAIRTREEYWRGRLSDLENELAELVGVAEERRVLAEERRIMAKALLRGWGREEMGFGVEDGQHGQELGHNMAESGWQLYEYLFAVANEDGIANGNGKEKGRKVTFRDYRDSMIG